MYLRYHDLTKPEQEIIWDYADQMRMLGWEILHAQYEREREGIRLVEVSDVPFDPSSAQ